MPAVHELQHVVMRVLHPDLHPCAAVAAQAPQLGWGDVIRAGLLSVAMQKAGRMGWG